MVDVRPFRAIRYTRLAGDPRDLVTQPYDKIDFEMQKNYYDRSPYNFCRLILPAEKDRYPTAQHRFNQWLDKGILAKDEAPAFYVCRQQFTLDGKCLTRTGFIAALRLYTYDERIVFPHETTYSEPKIDRLNMMRFLQKDLEPVFLMYSDPEGSTMSLFEEISKTKPIFETEDTTGVRHTIWKVVEPAKIKLLQAVMSTKRLVITDGHHRYESAIAYRDEQRKNSKENDENFAFNFHMSLIVPIQDEGLLALSTHRLLKKHTLTNQAIESLRHLFDVSEIAPTVSSMDHFLTSHRNEHAFCIYTKGKAYGLVLKHERAVYEFVKASSSKETKLFDVVILRDVIFKSILKTGELRMEEDISYERWAKTAVERVEKGDAQIAFLLNPINPKVVWEIAQQNERIPEKSTDFYPKPVSGLTVMDISPVEKILQN